jgi:hypothetical protein
VGAVWELLVFWSLCVFGCISVVFVVGACVRDSRGLGFCKVGIVGWSAGDECVRGRGSLVIGWGRKRGEGEGLGREWVKRSKTNFGGV